MWNRLKEWRKRKRAEIITGVILIAFSIVSLPVYGKAATVNDALQLYKDGDFLRAGKIYDEYVEKSPDNPVVLYNLGTVALKNNLYDEAAEYFTKALVSDDLKLQYQAYYNRGNSLYYNGMQTVQAEPEQTISIWKKALESFQAATGLEPQSLEAAENYAVVKKELEKLEKQQEQRKKEQQQNQQNQQDNKESQDSKHSPEKPQSTSQKNDKNEGKSQSQESDQKNSQQSKQQDLAQKNDNKESQPKPAVQNQKKGKQESGAVHNKEQKSTRHQTKEEKEANQQRRALGKMTKGEAEQLLDTLHDDETTFHFSPVDNENRTIEKNW